MIFLPGYDEICTAKKAIEERGADILEFNKLLIFTLHSKIKVIIVIFNCKYSITKVQVRIKKLTDIIIEWTEIYVMNSKIIILISTMKLFLIGLWMIFKVRFIM